MHIVHRDCFQYEVNVCKYWTNFIDFPTKKNDQNLPRSNRVKHSCNMNPRRSLSQKHDVKIGRQFNS